MMLTIYLIGIILCILWFLLASVLTFEKSVYDNASDEGKKSIDHMHETLESISPDNPQMGYLIISLFITITWPISVPYIFMKIKFK